MAEIRDYSVTADDNNASSPNGMANGCAPSTVNDTWREGIARMKRWYEDCQGAKTTTGSSNAYLLAASRVVASYAAGDAYMFKANHTNTSAGSTLNVDSVGAKAIVTPTGAAIAAGSITSGGVYLVAYEASVDKFMLIGGSHSGGDNPFIYNSSPTLTLENSTSEDTSGGRESQVVFKGLQSGSEESTLVKITASHEGTSDDQKGQLVIGVNDGNDNDAPTTAITVASTGNTTLAGNLIIPDAGNIGSASDTDAIAISSAGLVTISQDLTVSDDVTIGDDLLLSSDSAVIKFGSDADTILSHVADQGLALKNANTTDDKPATLYLQTGETDIALNDYLGRIFFQAPDEAAGTDAIAIAAEVSAISEGDFAADNNATSLSFGTGSSGASSQKMKLSSTGVLTLNGASGSIIIPDGGTIGSASDTDAITIASTGETSFTQNVGVGIADPVSFLHLEKSDATAYDATDSDGQVSVGPTIYLENPANANNTVGGQIVFGMRSTEAQARIGATGGTTPSLVFGTADAQRMEINSAGEVGIGAASKTSATLFVYNNETGHQAIDIHQDNSSSTSQVVNILNDGEGYGFYNVNSNGSGTYTQSSRGSAGYYRQTGSVASNYAIYAQGDANYGVYARTLSTGHGGLIAYDDAAACYGILGYSPSTTLYSLYGNGSTYITGSYTGSDSRLKDIQSRITTSDGMLAKVNQLKPTYYKWKANSDQGKADDTEQIGFIAQEVEAILSHVVKEAPVPDLSESPPDADGKVEKRDKTLNEELGNTKFITYEKLTVYLTAALQEASAKIDALEARIEALES